MSDHDQTTRNEHDRDVSDRTAPAQSAPGNTERAEPYDEEPMSPDVVTDTRGPEVTRMPGSARQP